MQMPVCLQFNWVDVQNGITMPNSNGPVLIQFEQQVEIVIRLVGLTNVPLKSGFFVVVISDRQVRIGGRLLTNIDAGPTVRQAPQRNPGAGEATDDQPPNCSEDDHTAAAGRRS